MYVPYPWLVDTACASFTAQAEWTDWEQTKECHREKIFEGQGCNGVELLPTLVT
jgi:hypothetical protein